MLDVLVTELGRCTSSTLVSAASGASAISNYKGALVLGQMLGKFLAIRREGDCSRDMSLFVRTGAIYVDHGNLSVLDCLLQFLDADIWEFTGKNRERTRIEKIFFIGN